ncbi:hypothetical protein LTR09_012821 [Extremus antarcticus]|uniref:Uncharacterized protein n=1 Tax=Extremus antarcticus TaxID=702011 RepID=A0AAJ0D9E4_9PEZI|nr:hypothetical protein LTR09_012821 [Extremus antarcticus]
MDVTLPSHEQLQQGEQIFDLALTEEEAAAVTLTQLGLRVQGVALGQDVTAAQEQEQAVPVDEHEAIYEDGNLPQDSTVSRREGANVGFFRRFAGPRTTTPEASHQAQRPLSQYFRSLPLKKFCLLGE